ncbi:MAG: isopentenyl-diphosphate Delta-isomerase, partial [Crocinitomicaceae bacterium]
MHQNLVVLVNELDQDLGVMEKLEAHQKGLLHRAFSVLIFNSNNELLLQRRAFGKYHSEGLWTNTCCSHPYLGETILAAGKRRLKEEMGMAVDLDEVFQFVYKAPLDNDLTEFELDHVLVGYSDDT